MFDEDAERLFAVSRDGMRFLESPADELDFSYIGFHQSAVQQLGLAPGDNIPAPREGRCTWAPLVAPVHAVRGPGHADAFVEIPPSELPTFRVELGICPCARAQLDATHLVSRAARHLINIDETRVGVVDRDTAWTFDLATGRVEQQTVPATNYLVTASVRDDERLLLGTNVGKVFAATWGSRVSISATPLLQIPTNGYISAMHLVRDRRRGEGLLIGSNGEGETGALTLASGIDTSTPTLELLIEPGPLLGEATADLIQAVGDERYLIRVDGFPETFFMDELKIEVRDELENLVSATIDTDGRVVGLFGSPETDEVGGLIQAYDPGRRDVSMLYDFGPTLLTNIRSLPHGFVLSGLSGQYQQLVKRSSEDDFGACEERALAQTGFVDEFLQKGSGVIMIERSGSTGLIVQATAVRE